MKHIVSLFGEKTEVFNMLNKRAEEYAKDLGFSYTWAPQSPFDKAEVTKILSHADAGIIDIEPYGEDIFSAIHNSCKLLVRFGVGFDKVDLKAASHNGIAIARTAGANTLGVAEMAFSLILASRRKLKAFDSAAAKGDWSKTVVNETIQGSIGIVGFGSIGRAVAKLFSGWDCEILAYDPHPDAAAMAALGAKPVSMEELFKRADAITLHIPYTPETHHIVNEKLLRLMKKSAVIVNTARGNIIDENALAAALKENRIHGAGLDVFGEEPLPVSSPLIGLPNIVLTPHVSSQTEQSLWRIYKMAIDITADFYAGIGSPHILNPDYK